MEKKSLAAALSSTDYPGRGIVIGRTADGRHAAAAYFIMGRSENSRNRIFVPVGRGIRTQAYDPAKLVDPSLIIYAPVRGLNDMTIVTNGDQTDTIYEGLRQGKTMEQALRTREFEPDAPNYTPRISGLIMRQDGDFTFMMSILKSDDGRGDACVRQTFAYENVLPGTARFIHTYQGNGSPLPSFAGEPEYTDLPGADPAETADLIWKNLNEENRVSLFVRYIDLESGDTEDRIINKNV